MKFSKNIHISKSVFNLIILLISIKLMFSYLMVDLGYWLRDLTSNYKSYNFLNLPKSFSGKIEFLLFPIMLFYIFYSSKKSSWTVRLIALLLLFLLLNVVTSFYNSKIILDSIQLSLKLMSPVLFFTVLIIHHEKYSFDIKTLSINLSKLCLLLTMIGLLFFNPSANRGPQRFLPIFFESIHTHSYILVSVFIIISHNLYTKKKRLKLCVFLALSFLFLWLGYEIRTAILVYLIYLLFVLYNLHTFFKYLWIKALVYIPLIILILNFSFYNFNVDEVSSGRLSMYSEKYDQIKTYNAIELLIGRGEGSDLIRSEIWSFGKKGAHSDIITYFIENGALFVISFFYLLQMLLFIKKKISIIYLSLILGYFFSAIFSNGITSRPLAGYMFFLALSMVYIQTNKYKTNERKNIS